MEMLIKYLKRRYTLYRYIGQRTDLKTTRDVGRVRVRART